MKIRPVGAELFHADGRRDSMTKKNVAFRNFANAPNNAISGTSTVKNYQNGNFLAIK